MRETFAHDALLTMRSDGDLGAPGAAVTQALCGHWDHEPPCPLAPHHTSAQRADGGLRLRILFVAEPEQELAVRDRIQQGLSSGLLVGPGGVNTRWEVVSSEPDEVRAEERDHAERLRRG